jgi:signal peptidase I
VPLVKPSTSGVDQAGVKRRQPQPSLPLGRPVRRRHGVRLVFLGAVALAVVWLAIRPSLAYYRITSGSMEPTLRIGQRVSIDRKSHAPAVGDIVVFHPPSGALPDVPACGVGDEGAGYPQPCGLSTFKEASITFVKRIVAGPGDLVSIVHGHAIRNGAGERSSYGAASCADATRCSFPTPIRVPAGDYYLLGDNRGVSDDSRFWGPVPRSWIVGTVVRCSLLGAVCRPVR